MTQVILPNTSKRGANEDWNHVESNDQAIADVVNGNLDSTNLAANAVTTAKITDGNVTAAKIGTIPQASVQNTINQSIANDSATAITFDTENFDTDAIHSTATNTSRLSATTAGVYVIAGTLAWESNATGIRELRIVKNGSTIIANDQRTAVSGASTIQNVTAVYKLAAGDYVELVARQTSGSSRQVLASEPFGMTWMGSG